MSNTQPTIIEATLRDYFAATALQGILACGFADTVPHDDVRSGQSAAIYAYLYADAMMEARTFDDASKIIFKAREVPDAQQVQS